MIAFFLLLQVYAITFEVKNIEVKGINLKVEIADTEKKHAHGLMYRKELKDIYGMLFIFPKEEMRGFWMKNTYIPLSIGYFNKNRILIDIQDMQPLKKNEELVTYKSKSPAKYALEVPLGWFKSNKVGLGSRLSFK